MFFVARFREEYGFEPNPRDKSVREYFSWYGWGHAAREMGWAANKKIHPLMDCSDCGEFRGHGHVCKPNARAMTPSANKNENE
jgi:ribosomal protein L32